MFTKEAKAAAEYLKNGIHRNNSWVRVCLIYKGSYHSPNSKGINRLLDALSIHYDGVCFGRNDIGDHYEIACSDEETAGKAREYIAGWIAKG